MLIEVKLEQSEKADSPIEVTPSGMVIEVKLEQYAKVASPIEVTPLGMVTEVKLEHPQNLQVVLYQQFAYQTVEK